MKTKWRVVSERGPVGYVLAATREGAVRWGRRNLGRVKYAEPWSPELDPTMASVVRVVKLQVIE